MMAERMSSLHRVPLPSRMQVQIERERLERKSQRMRVLLRWSAGGMALFLLFSVLSCLCFSVLCIADDALQPILQAGDCVLLLRTASTDRGEFFAYTDGNRCFVVSRGDMEDRAETNSTPLGRVLLRFRKTGSIALLT